MGRPMWYFERHARRPEHIPAGRLDVLPSVGVPGLEPGGYLVGGDEIPADGWSVHDGWAVHIPADAKPNQFLRVDAIDGPTIDGWIMPEIIRPNGILAVSQTARLVQGRLCWVPPAHLTELVERLRAVLDQPVEDIVATDAGLALACDLTAINYHLSAIELGLTGWMTTPRARAALIAAVGGHG